MLALVDTFDSAGRKNLRDAKLCAYGGKIAKGRVLLRPDRRAREWLRVLLAPNGSLWDNPYTTALLRQERRRRKWRRAWLLHEGRFRTSELRGGSKAGMMGRQGASGTSPRGLRDFAIVTGPYDNEDVDA